jgi:hypothetical protein
MLLMPLSQVLGNFFIVILAGLARLAGASSGIGHHWHHSASLH